jgi:predicted transcriptional regulator
MDEKFYAKCAKINNGDCLKNENGISIFNKFVIGGPELFDHVLKGIDSDKTLVFGDLYHAGPKYEGANRGTLSCGFFPKVNNNKETVTVYHSFYNTNHEKKVITFERTEVEKKCLLHISDETKDLYFPKEETYNSMYSRIKNIDMRGVFVVKDAYKNIHQEKSIELYTITNGKTPGDCYHVGAKG